MANRDFDINLKLRTEFAKANADLDRAAKELDQLYQSGSKADRTLAQTIARYNQSSSAASKLALDERRLREAVDEGRISQETMGRSLAKIAAQRAALSIGDDAQRMGGMMSSGVGVAAAGLAGLVTSLVSVGAAVGAVKGAIDYADSLNDMTIRLGLSAEKVSAWGYAAKQTGTDIDGLGLGMKKLLDNMGNAAANPNGPQGEMFKRLGISVVDATGKVKDLETIVPEIADKFRGLGSDAEKTQVAMDLFGKAGTNLIEFLELGGDGLSAMETRARELGLVLSKDTLQAADDFNDGLSDLKAVTGAMAQTIASAMLPHLESFVTGMVAWWKEGDNAKNVTDLLKGSVDLLGSIVSGAGEVISTFNSILGGTGTFAQNAASDVRKLASDMRMFGNIAGGFKDFVIASAQGNEAAVNAARERFKKGVSTDSRFQDVGAETTTRQKLPGKDFVDIQSSVTSLKGGPLSSDVRPRAGGGSGGRRVGGGGGGRSGGASSAISEAQRLAQQAQQRIDQLKEEVALAGQLADGETKLSEAQRARYDTTEGKWKSLAPKLKEELIAAAEAKDAMLKAAEAKKADKDASDKAAAAYDRLRESLRTPAEVALEKAIAETNVLNEAIAKTKLVTEEQKAALQARIAQGLTEKQPEFQGLAPEVGGAFGEFQKLQEQQAIEEKWYQDSLERQRQYLLTKGADRAASQAETERITALHQQRMAQIEGSKQQAMLTMAGSFFGQLATLQNSKNKQMARVGKAAAIAQTVIATYQSATQAYAAMSKVPYIGPALGIAAAAAAVAAGLANVQQIRSQPEGYATGGYTGDGGKYEPAGVVHRGEFVVRKEVTRSPRVRAMLENLNQNGPAALYGWTQYADGGLVSMPSQPMGNLDRVTPSLNIPAPKVNQQTVVVFDEDAVARQVAANQHMETRILRVIAENPRALGGG